MREAQKNAGRVEQSNPVVNPGGTGLPRSPILRNPFISLRLPHRDDLIPAVRPPLLKCANFLDHRRKKPETMNRVTKRRYSAEFKAQAVGLVGLGKPVSVVAKELGIGEGVLYAWVSRSKGSQSAELGSEGLRAVGELPAADELRRLRRENVTLKMENDILKKAAVILGIRPQPGDGQ